MIRKTKGNMLLTEFHLRQLEVSAGETEREMTHGEGVKPWHWLRLSRLCWKQRQACVPRAQNDGISHSIRFGISPLHPQDAMIPFQRTLLISDCQSDVIKAADLKHHLLL